MKNQVLLTLVNGKIMASVANCELEVIIENTDDNRLEVMHEYASASFQEKLERAEKEAEEFDSVELTF